MAKLITYNPAVLPPETYELPGAMRARAASDSLLMQLLGAEGGVYANRAPLDDTSTAEAVFARVIIYEPPLSGRTENRQRYEWTPVIVEVQISSARDQAREVGLEASAIHQRLYALFSGWTPTLDYADVLIPFERDGRAGGLIFNTNTGYWEAPATYRITLAPLGQGVNSLAFTTEPDQDAISGEIYSYTAMADHPGGSIPTITALVLPDFLTATAGSGSLTLEGTPDAGDLGSYTIRLQAESDGKITYQAFTLSVTLAEGITGLPAPDVYSILQGNADGDGWDVVKSLTLEDRDETISIGVDAVGANAALIDSTRRYIMRALPFNGVSAMMYLGNTAGGALFSLYSLSPTVLRASLDVNGNWLAANTLPMPQAEAEAGVSTTQRTVSAAVLAAAIAKLGGGIGWGSLVDTEANLLATEPENATLGYASDTRVLYVYTDAWRKHPFQFASAASTGVDLGSSLLENNVLGYGRDYVSDKRLSDVNVGSNRYERPGGLDVRVDENGLEQFAIFLRGAWNDLPLDMYRDEMGRFIHVPGGYLNIYVHSGDSIELNASGNPIMQEYTITLGGLS